MIQFNACANLCTDGNSDEKLKEFVANLNNKFSNLGCECHPDATWNIAVDLQKDCTFKIHQYRFQNPPCNYWDTSLKDIVEQEIKE